MNQRAGPEFASASGEEVECLSDAEVTAILDRKISQTDRRRRVLCGGPLNSSVLWTPRSMNTQLKRTYDYVKRSLGKRDVDSVRKESIHLREQVVDPQLDATTRGAAGHSRNYGLRTRSSTRSKSPRSPTSWATTPRLKR